MCRVKWHVCRDMCPCPSGLGGSTMTCHQPQSFDQKPEIRATKTALFIVFLYVCAWRWIARSGRAPARSGQSLPRSTIHDPRSTIHDPRSTIHDPRSMIHDPRSTIHDPRSTIHDPRSTIHDPRSIVTIYDHNPRSGSKFRDEARRTVYQDLLIGYRIYSNDRMWLLIQFCINFIVQFPE
jgi:hypothetical protein